MTKAFLAEDQRYEKLIGQIVVMIRNAKKWTIGI
jgi:hypothetical protein